MFFKSTLRINPAIGRQSVYYRLVESYRNVLGDIRQRTILSVGFMEGLNGHEVREIGDRLNDLVDGQGLLDIVDSKIRDYTISLYNRLVSEKKIDVLKDTQALANNGDWQTIDMNSIQNKDIRELGSEWMSLQTLWKLGLDVLLKTGCGFTEEETSLALAHIVCRAVYPASELKTVSFIRENSSICELTGLDMGKITKDRLYSITEKLYKERQRIEQFLSRKTNELFDLKDKIILYDLTNTYFESDKRASHIAKRGRSKEKRSDCPLIVLALVVNVEGFVKYSAIYEGNKSDCSTLPEMIDKLRLASSESKDKAIVVMDAGIATEENLKLIKAKGYDYVCVSRKNLKHYSPIQGVAPVKVSDRKGQEIELVQVCTEDTDQTDTEYFMKVISQGKQLKESSMHNQFIQRFEEGLEAIARGITGKNGTKKYDKVNQRIGRLKQKYPSVHRMYTIELDKDLNDTCRSIQWKRTERLDVEKKENQGVYFIRASLPQAGQELVWTVYNCIREVESSFRCLKSDLELRPVFHKTDQASQAHLHLGLLAYWVVNTIRFQLKKEGVHSNWRELVRVMNTQKCVTTSMINSKNEQLHIRCCSKPTEKVRLIYHILKMKEAPFIRKKSVVPKINPKKMGRIDLQKDNG